MSALFLASPRRNVYKGGGGGGRVGVTVLVGGTGVKVTVGVIEGVMVGVVVGVDVAVDVGVAVGTWLTRVIFFEAYVSWSLDMRICRLNFPGGTSFMSQL